MHRLIVLANRSPYAYDLDEGGRPRVRRTASGLVTALEPLVTRHGGTWVAHAAGTAAALVTDAAGRVRPGYQQGAYGLRYVQLAAEEYRGYYDGFANEGLWALCHEAGVAPVFRPGDARLYRLANQRFAEAVCEEAGTAPATVMVQDYHFALAPYLIRRRLPASRIVAYWHVPWPSAERLGDCPWAGEVLVGLLGADLVGLQTEADCSHFLQGVAAATRARVDLARGTVTLNGVVTRVRAVPVGVEWTAPAGSDAPTTAACRSWAGEAFALPARARLIVGVDRLDYTKGLAHKVRAVERLLETRADLRGRLVLAQVAEPSREQLPAYQAARDELLAAAARVNVRFGRDGYVPIQVHARHYDACEVDRLYRAADVCYVASLHDGMNLVAKEFVRARDDGRGVLVLSERAGAARQLTSALPVPPTDLDAAARTLGRALDMPAHEQASRLRRLREGVRTHDARWWADRLLDEAQWAPSAREAGGWAKVPA